MSLGRRVVSALLFLSVGLPLVQGFVGRLGFPHRAVRSGSRLFADVSLNEDDYVAVGYAVCFKINSETNKPEEFPIIEPIPSAMLECLDKGVPTSYKRVVRLRASSRDLCKQPRHLLDCLPLSGRLPARRCASGRPHGGHRSEHGLPQVPPRQRS